MSACPFCHEIKTRVIETRTMQNGWVRRSRLCAYDCKGKWFTYEIAEQHLNVSVPHEDDLKEFPRQRMRQ